jgi:hypothetical protein
MNIDDVLQWEQRALFLQLEPLEGTTDQVNKWKF